MNKALIITPTNRIIQCKFDLINSKAFVLLSQIQVVGLKSISDVNLLNVTIQYSDLFGKKTEPKYIDIKISPFQKLSVFDINRKLKRFKEEGNIFDLITITFDAQAIAEFEEIQLRYELNDAYKVEKLEEIPDDFLRVVYFDIRDRKKSLEDFSEEVQIAFRNSGYMKLL
jgi:hypothetical protein